MISQAQNDLTKDTERLIIVSNRLPVSLERSKEGGEIKFSPSVGGLATSLKTLDLEQELLWFGWPGLLAEEVEDERKIENHLREKYGCLPLFLSEKEFDRYYHGFSNRCIWPLFHYFTQHVRFDTAEWHAYQEVNRLFCENLIEFLQPDDCLWVQDYHLMLLPAMVREHLPDLSIGFFLHIPFPSSEIFRMLPWREKILEGVIGADLIGFHTFSYARHFLSSILCVLGLQNEFGQLIVRGRPVNVDTFPLGVDVHRFAKATNVHVVNEELRALRLQTERRKVVLSVDRLDFTKGIPQRLLAIEQFLEKHMDWHNKVNFITLCVPSRIDVPEYQSLKEQIDELVGRINGRFSKPGWTPIWYLYRAVPFEELVALYLLADVALVTPIRDGMNLVAKEYLASRTDGTGVLILSETAGAAEELGDALIVNPHDQQSIVDALHEGLNLSPEEQITINKYMLDHLQRYNANRWAGDFLKKLVDARTQRPHLMQKKLDGKWREALLQEYKQSKRRLLLLDYDGTLMPFKRIPDAVTPDANLLDLLSKLVQRKENTVVVISGRDRGTLERWLGGTGTNLVAEHGAYLHIANSGKWTPLETNPDQRWKHQLCEILEAYVARTPGAFLEEKEFSLVWHYRKTEPGLGSMRVKELIDHLESMITNTPLHIVQGNHIVEIKLSSINKGKAARRFIERSPSCDFIVAIGDDMTDEDTFMVLPDESWSLKVGRDRNSKARFYVANSDEARRLLADLASAS